MSGVPGAGAGASAVTPREPVHALVLNWNGESDTTACLDSLVAQRDVALKIVLIDNASSDGSGGRLRDRFPGVHYLQTGSNLGYAGGNNVGIEWALADGARWILVINNDTVVDARCVRRLLDVLQAEAELGAVAPTIARFDDPSRVWCAGGRLDHVRAAGVHLHEGAPIEDVVRDARCSRWTPCSFLSGCCLLARADALRDTGGFRGDFFAYVEDVDLSLRLARAGWGLGWVPGARIAHRVPPRRAAPSAGQIVLRDRNRRRMVRDQFGPGARLRFALWFFPTRAVHLLRYVASGDLQRARAVVEGMTRP